MRATSIRRDFLSEYTARAPLALALERTLECQMLSSLEMRRPILDLGCGDGLFAAILFEQAIDTGVDPDSGELDEARKLGAYHELIRCSGAEIPKPDGSFQTVFSNSVLEHIPDLAPVLKEVMRILVPGGVFYFTVPSENFEICTVVNQLLTRTGFRRTSPRYRQFFNRFWKHYHAYPDAEWRSMAAAAGFRDIETTRYNAPRIALLNDALVPLALPSMLMKKLLSRWVIWPAWRRVFLFPVRGMLRSCLSPAPHPAGCLVLVKAIKPPNRT